MSIGRKFFQSYVDTVNDDPFLFKDRDVIEMLNDRSFSKKYIQSEDTIESVKVMAGVMVHSLSKPQKAIVDEDDHYVALDINTNTYYICYKHLMMIDLDSYKENIPLSSIIEKLASRKEFFFRIYGSRNGYHVFIINKEMNYRDDQSIELMRDLGCDYFYMVFSYIRGWCVRLNRKKGEEGPIYHHVGDVVGGKFFTTNDKYLSLMKINSNNKIADSYNQFMEKYGPIPRLEDLLELHIDLSSSIQNVPESSMPAPV